LPDRNRKSETDLPLSATGIFGEEQNLNSSILLPIDVIVILGDRLIF
jgi:hypothetical protein